MDSVTKVSEWIENAENRCVALFECVAYLVDPARRGNKRAQSVKASTLRTYGKELRALLEMEDERPVIPVRYPSLLVGVFRALHRIGMFPGVPLPTLIAGLRKIFIIDLKDSSIKTLFYDSASEYDGLENDFSGYIRKVNDKK